MKPEKSGSRYCGKSGPDDEYIDEAEKIKVARYWVGEIGFELMESTTPDGDVASLTGAEAKHVDQYIDEFNGTIRTLAGQNGWHMVDTCGVLDGIAVRRNHGQPSYPLPSELMGLNTRFFEIESNGKIINGGLISLDGVHPTTCGYGIVAQEFINVMRKQNPGIQDIDFSAVRAMDSLVSRPPKTLDDVFGMLRTLEKWFHISRIMGS